MAVDPEALRAYQEFLYARNAYRLWLLVLLVAAAILSVSFWSDLFWLGMITSWVLFITANKAIHKETAIMNAQLKILERFSK